MKRVVLLFINICMLLYSGSVVFGQEILTGYVIKIEESLIYFDRGYLDGVQSGQTYTLYRSIPELGEKNIGIIQILQVFPEVSVGKLLESFDRDKVSMLDMIDIPVFEPTGEEDTFEEMPELSKDFYIPSIVHQKIETAPAGRNIPIYIRAHGYDELQGVYIIYKVGNKGEWRNQELEFKEGDMYSGMISGEEITERSIFYFISALDINNRIGFLGSPDNPIKIRIEGNILQAEKTSLRSSEIFSAPGKGRFPLSILVPGYQQIKSGRKTRGFAIIGLEAGAIAGTVTSKDFRGTYITAAVLIYLYNIVDGYYITNLVNLKPSFPSAGTGSLQKEFFPISVQFSF